ncbi:MAG: hypothetical protein K2Y03_08925 [Sphingomonas sp.]|nr:hypothetical protein [Sphingomonas sp.]
MQQPPAWSLAIALRAAAGETHPVRLIHANPAATDWVHLMIDALAYDWLVAILRG